MRLDEGRSGRHRGGLPETEAVRLGGTGEGGTQPEPCEEPQTLTAPFQTSLGQRNRTTAGSTIDGNRRIR